MRTILILVLLLAVVGSAAAQDPCDIESIRASAMEDLNNAQSLNDVRTVRSHLYVLISSCAPGTDPGQSRLDPLPYGEWLQLESGKVRVSGIVDAYTSERYAPPDGMRFIAVSIEYLCESDNPDVSCRGIDSTPRPVLVSEDGNIYQEAPVYENIISGADSEGYAGTTLTGNRYFQVPRDDAPQLLRIEPRFDEFFFFALPE